MSIELSIIQCINVFTVNTSSDNNPYLNIGAPSCSIHSSHCVFVYNIKLFDSLVIPILNYGSDVWGVIRS